MVLQNLMNILSVYISDKDEKIFEYFLMDCCQKIDNAFYFDNFQFYFDKNNCILDELNLTEFNDIRKSIGCFVAYSIVYKDLDYLFHFLKNEKLNINFLLDNDNGRIMDNKAFVLMCFQDFTQWVGSK